MTTQQDLHATVRRYVKECGGLAHAPELASVILEIEHPSHASALQHAAYKLYQVADSLGLAGWLLVAEYARIVYVSRFDSSDPHWNTERAEQLNRALSSYADTAAWCNAWDAKRRTQTIGAPAYCRSTDH